MFPFRDNHTVSPSQLPQVIPLHGSVHYVMCTGPCRSYWSIALWDQLLIDPEPPICLRCHYARYIRDHQLGGSLRPRLKTESGRTVRTAVVLYDEPANSEHIQTALSETASRAFAACQKADVTLYVVAGASLGIDNKQSLNLLVDLVTSSSRRRINKKNSVKVLWINPNKACPSALLKLENVEVYWVNGDVQEVAALVQQKLPRQ